MVYEAPDIEPYWLPTPKEGSNENVIYPLDSFGTQWAECDRYKDGFVKCDLKSVDKEGNVHVYGRYYYKDGKWRLIIPPGVFVYSEYGYDLVRGVVKGGEVKVVEEKDVESGDVVDMIVSADAVIVGSD